MEILSVYGTGILGIILIIAGCIGVYVNRNGRNTYHSIDLFLDTDDSDWKGMPWE